jgi:DNA repair exonuclease SbcCD ATPase subunit
MNLLRVLLSQLIKTFEKLLRELIMTRKDITRMEKYMAKTREELVTKIAEHRAQTTQAQTEQSAAFTRLMAEIENLRNQQGSNDFQSEWDSIDAASQTLGAMIAASQQQLPAPTPEPQP